MYIRTVKWDRNKTLRVYPVSDVHWPNHEQGRLQDWLDTVKKDRYGIVTFGGDMFDFARTHARNHLKSYTDDPNSFRPIDRMAQEYVDDAAEFFDPIKDKLAGAIAGNHFHQFPDGQISDQKLALKFEEETWMGACGYIIVKMDGYNLKIFMHHDGGRAGSTPGADLNAFTRAAQNVEADIIIFGHTHRLINVPGSTRVTVDKGKIGDHQTIFVRSGSYQKRYHEEKKDDRRAPYMPDYGEMKLFAPSTFGHAVVEVKIRNGKPKYTLSTEVL